MTVETKSVDSLIDANQGSPLDLLGGSQPNSENLLDEMLGELKPGKTFGGFVDAKAEARKGWQAVLDDESPARQDPDPEDEPEPKPEPKPKPEPTSEWHAFNHEQQVIRERQEAFERAAHEERQQTHAALGQLLQRTAPQQQPENYEEYGFESPEAFKQYEQRLQQQIEQKIYQSQAPLFYQMAQDRFVGAIAEASTRYEHFNTYYPKEKLNAYFTELSRRLSPQQLASINWAHEWGPVYKAADYDRLDREAKEQAVKASPAAQKSQQQRHGQKENLKLVPKASQQGTNAKASRLESDLDRLSPKLTFGQFGREMKKKLFT